MQGFCSPTAPALRRYSALAQGDGFQMSQAAKVDDTKLFYSKNIEDNVEDMEEM